MGRGRKPKHKLSRREGKDLFGTGGPSLQRSLDQPPGMHGRRQTRKVSVYAEQLREKQKVKRMYELRVDIPSYLLKPGQEIVMKESALQIPDVQELARASSSVTGWLEQRNGGGVVVREPNREEIDPDIQEQRIVEFYSR